MCRILHLLKPLPCKTCYYKECNKNYKNLVLDVIRTFDTSNQTIFLQPPKYLLLIVNRFRYTNNNFTKDRSSIPMDTTVMLGHLKFSLRATIDHHGHTFWSLYCIYQLLKKKKKHSITTTTKLQSLKLLIAKIPLLHMLYFMNWLTYEFWTRTGGWEFDYSHGTGTSSPSC